MVSAKIQLFAIGSAGNGSQALPLLQQAAYTDSLGGFSLVSNYSCAAANQQVYVVATGGSPGLGNSVSNAALVLISAIGNCGDLAARTQLLTINEVTTAAAAYALAPFAAAFDHIGASATNQLGIANAFLNAHLLGDLTTGQAATVAPNLTVEQGKLYALANTLAACAGSDGGSACAPLFSAATLGSGSGAATVPADTFTALLNIVKNPGSHVAAIYNAQASPAPYPTTLAEAPNDWSMSLTVTGGGLYEPTALAVDKFGNVWVTNFGGPSSDGSSNPVGVVAYSPQGLPFAGTPFNSGQTEAYGLTLDTHGDVWVTSEENVGHGNTTGSVAKLQGASSTTPGTFVSNYSDDSLYFPEAIAADTTANTILIANYASGTATVYDLNGNYLRNVGLGSSSYSIGVASDGAGGLWLANEGAEDVTHIAADGTAQNTTCCAGPGAVAVDPGGNVWVPNTLPSSAGYTFSEVSGTGTVRLAEQTAAGLFTPGGVAIDAAGQFWATNYYNGSFTGIAGNTNTLPVGSGLYPIPLGKDAGLLQPFAIAPDASGNLWISNRVHNSLVMFFGLATPTLTPAAPLPTAP